MSSSIQNALDAIRARALARLDHLTGLFNSRYFHIRLEDEIAHADHNATDLSLLFIDLDHFKEVNDRYGHLAGSWTLREVARLLSENAPPAAVLARYGGDEFVAILPGSDIHRAVQTAEGLRRVIAEATMFDAEAEGEQTAQPLPGVRASIGVASYREHLAPGATNVGGRICCCASLMRPCTGPRPMAATASRWPTRRSEYRRSSREAVSFVSRPGPGSSVPASAAAPDIARPPPSAAALRFLPAG